MGIPVTPALTLTLIQIAKVILEAGDAHITSEGFGTPYDITVTPAIILIRWIVTYSVDSAYPTFECSSKRIIPRQT